jgi:hypothetical protein
VVALRRLIPPEDFGGLWRVCARLRDQDLRETGLLFPWDSFPHHSGKQKSVDSMNGVPLCMDIVEPRYSEHELMHSAAAALPLLRQRSVALLQQPSNSANEAGAHSVNCLILHLAAVFVEYHAECVGFQPLQGAVVVLLAWVKLLAVKARRQTPPLTIPFH